MGRQPAVARVGRTSPITSFCCARMPSRAVPRRANATRENTRTRWRGRGQCKPQVDLAFTNATTRCRGGEIRHDCHPFSQWRESQQPAGSYIPALSAGKARLQPNVTRRIENNRLAGGEGGIRTQGDFFPKHPFQPCRFQPQDLSSEGDAQPTGHGRSIDSLVDVQGR